MTRQTGASSRVSPARRASRGRGGITTAARLLFRIKFPAGKQTNILLTVSYATKWFGTDNEGRRFAEIGLSA